MTQRPLLNLILLSLVLFLSNCNDTKKEKELPKGRLDFEPVKGIKFYEGKRRFSSGLSFNEMGFQQEPSWIIEFKSNDTVLVYSPQDKKMFPFFITYDHGDVYNFAKNYFRIKAVNKDSLVFQRLHVFKKEIFKDVQSDVHMTFYTKNYIDKKLKTPLEQLQRPTQQDTLYIKRLTERSNRNPVNPDSAFAGRIPVQLSPVSNLIKVRKANDSDPVMGIIESYDYLFPRYRIDIASAYKDFGFEFSVLVDANGKIHLGSFGNVIPEHRAARKKTLEAIIDVYLQNLLKITPGKTLGIPHSSEIKLVVVGKKSNK